MGISYKNGSGCPDPTAYYAVQHMEAEEKRLHIRYPAGQMVLEIERFFPCNRCESKETFSADPVVLREDREGKTAAFLKETGDELLFPNTGISEPGEKVRR